MLMVATMQDLVPTSEVAASFGITPSAVAQRVRAGTLTPAAKLPGVRGAYLFERSEIERVQAES